MFREISPYALTGNLMDRVGNEWMLLAAEYEGQVNAMTASWGGTGILWRKPVAFVFIRPTRFTKKLVDGSGMFSCTFFPGGHGGEMGEALNLCGTKSGRDMDKIAATGLEVLREGAVPYFAQADVALICKSLYRQTLDPGCFLVDGIDQDCYPKKDYHDLYVGEIEKVLVK